MNDTSGRGRESPPVLPGSADLLRRIIDQAAIGMVLLGEDGRWLYANPALCSLIGYSLEECVSRSIDTVIHPQERDDVRLRLGALRRGEIGAYRVERRYVRKDGSTLHGLVSVSALGAAEDAPFHFILQIIDIGPRKQAEAELGEVTERLQLAIEAGGIGIYEQEFATGRYRWDERMHRLYGLSQGGFDGTLDGWLRLIHPDDIAHVMREYDVSLQPTSLFQADYRILHQASDTVRHVRSLARVIRAADGSPLRAVGTTWDITDHKQAEARLAALNERLVVALDAGGVGIFEIDFTTDERDWDARTLEVHGVSADSFDRSTDGFRQLLPPEDAARVLGVHEAAARDHADQYRVDYRVRHQASGTTRHVRASIRLAYAADGTLRRGLGACWDITEDVERSRRLHDTLALLQAVMNGTPDLIYVKDRDGHYLLANPAMEKAMGRAGIDVIGRLDTDIFPLDTAQVLIENDRRVLATGEPLTAEEPAEVLGVTRIYSSVKAPLRDERGGIIGLIGISRDLTAMKTAEAALRRSEARWQFALDGAGDGIWDWDFDTGHVFYSRQWKAMLGYDEDEIGTSTDEWSDRVHPEDLPRCWSIINDHLAGRSPDFALEHRMRAKDGSWRWILNRGKVVERADGRRARRIIGTHSDITDRVDLAQALFEEKERLRVTLHSIGDAVISTDALARITFMNPAAEQMTGWPAEEAMGRPLYQVLRLADETGGAVPDPVEACLTRMQPYHLDYDVVLLARSGEKRHIRNSAAPVRTASGDVIGTVLVFQDVTRDRTLQQALAHSASHDSLTGLPNRLAFERALREACEQAQRDGREHVLCFLDLDRFKIVNDGAGHAAGDALLREVANLLRRRGRDGDLIARLGGDEFAMLLRDCTIGDGVSIARQLIRAVAELRFTWDDKAYQIGASIGLTAVETDGPRADELLSQADVACYTAKTAGRNRVSVYGGHGSEAQRHRREIQVAAGIRDAIEAGRFRLFAQGIRDLRPGREGARHVEILLRMEDDNGQIVEPSGFIPASERYDLMGNLDRWVIRTALHGYGPQLRGAPDLSIGINLSANTLDDPFLWPFLKEELAASGLHPGRLHFEITETAVMNNLAAATRFVAKTRAAGCAVVLDDFGSGLSSFAYLRQFAVDGLKIDGGFIRRIATSAVDRAIVESINAIGHRLGAVTVAEQVEDDETLELVRAMGIDQAQGFAVERPRPLESLF